MSFSDTAGGGSAAGIGPGARKYVHKMLWILNSLLPSGIAGHLEARGRSPISEESSH